MTTVLIVVVALLIVAALAGTYAYRTPRSGMRIRGGTEALTGRGRYIRATARLVVHSDYGRVYEITARRRHRPLVTVYVPPARALAVRWIKEHDTYEETP